MCVINPVEIGQRIKARREELNISRADFISKAGITDSALSNYESGIRVPRDEVKVSIAKALETTVEAIFFS